MGQPLTKFYTNTTNNKIEKKKSAPKMTDFTTTAAITTEKHVSSLQSKRDFHTNQASTYWLPKDEEEQHRLTGVSSIIITKS
jgi:hypothetical protein